MSSYNSGFQDGAQRAISFILNVLIRVAALTLAYGYGLWHGLQDAREKTGSVTVSKTKADVAMMIRVRPEQ
jgi:hypothetical protein